MMLLDEAQKIADYLVKEFTPYCERIEVGGSVRRKSPHVSDIEIVCIPHYIWQKTFDGSKTPAGNKLYPMVGEMATKINKKGDKYMQFILDGVFGNFLLKAVKIDLFLSIKENFGLNFLIRTGSAEFTRSILGYANSKGYHSEGSILQDSEGKSYPMSEETEVFEFLGLPFIPPQEREGILDRKYRE